MAGALATKTILDSTGATVTMRVWDESGAGTGPFSFVSYISSQSVNANGAATGANSAPVVLATDGVTIGPVTETAPASDTASSGLNGRLQRIAQNITTLIASTLKTKEVKSATGTQSIVAASAASVTVLASNANRLGATIFNDSTIVAYLLLTTGGTASTTVYTVQVAASGYYEVPFGYTGDIKGIWASATGNARVTELT